MHVAIQKIYFYEREFCVQDNYVTRQANRLFDRHLVVYDGDRVRRRDAHPWPAFARNSQTGCPQHREDCARQAPVFDTRLSADGRVSCASCHQPDKAFTDGKPVAVGVNGKQGTRNTPSVLNMQWQHSFFWDGRRSSLEAQVLDAFVGPAEQGFKDHAVLLHIMQGDRDYRRQFAQAFDLKAAPGVLPPTYREELMSREAGRRERPATLAQDPAITKEQVARALADFVRSLTAGDAPFDRYYYANDKRALSAAAQRGLEVFRGAGQCATCHLIGEHNALFTDQQFHSVGVALERIRPQLATLTMRVVNAKPEQISLLIATDPAVAALGRFLVTKEPVDIGRFKTPSLRNVALTAPYMHDGSIPTLEEAVEREVYYRGLSTGRPLILTPAEKADLIEFLKALTSTGLPGNR
ncbi:MAG: hypothetical protein HY028_06130 [Gammaproteobacteria bacterium]|nr:hypothetical protein [Gammaproteobacteria bacterium]